MAYKNMPKDKYAMYMAKQQGRKKDEDGLEARIEV
jgi:hypothetical protein